MPHPSHPPTPLARRISLLPSAYFRHSRPFTCFACRSAGVEVRAGAGVGAGAGAGAGAVDVGQCVILRPAFSAVVRGPSASINTCLSQCISRDTFFRFTCTSVARDNPLNLDTPTHVYIEVTSLM